MFFWRWALGTLGTIEIFFEEHNASDCTLRPWCVASYILSRVHPQFVKFRVYSDQFQPPFISSYNKNVPTCENPSLTHRILQIPIWFSIFEDGRGHTSWPRSALNCKLCEVAWMSRSLASGRRETPVLRVRHAMSQCTLSPAWVHWFTDRSRVEWSAGNEAVVIGYTYPRWMSRSRHWRDIKWEEENERVIWTSIDSY